MTKTDLVLTALKNLIQPPTKHPPLPSRDLMWVPINGKETEIWAARSPDGKRHYNVRKEWVGPACVWSALWSHTDDGTPNVFTTRFLGRWEAQQACETFEHTFPIDQKEVEEERQRVQLALSPIGWTFQGIYDGTSIWTFRHNDNQRECYVITNNLKNNHTKQYELTFRSFPESKYVNTVTLKIESMGVYDTLEQAKNIVTKRLGS